MDIFLLFISEDSELLFGEYCKADDFPLSLSLSYILPSDLSWKKNSQMYSE